MSEIGVVFWDVGGVLLTNGWDRQSRRSAAEAFDLDLDEFEYLHEATMPDFEIGRLDLDEYLNRTVFHRARAFTTEEIKDFIFAQSRPHAQTLEILKRLASAHARPMVMLNNESLALNRFRINHFGLHRLFDVFLSSCFLGARKPNAEIFERAMNIMQMRPEQCLFIDDRQVNLEYPGNRGMETIHYTSAERLARELSALDLMVGPV